MSNFATGGQSESLEQTSQPQLCTASCGFFANVGCGGLCSKCHRDQAAQEAKKQQQQRPVEIPSFVAPPLALELKQAVPTHCMPSIPSTGEPATSSCPEVASAEAVKCGPSRCNQCRKKVGLTGFKCKCGETFCGQHRHAESHCCSFDYKTVQRQKLADSNPVVQAQKVQKI